MPRLAVGMMLLFHSCVDDMSLSYPWHATSSVHGLSMCSWRVCIPCPDISMSFWDFTSLVYGISRVLDIYVYGHDILTAVSIIFPYPISGTLTFLNFLSMTFPSLFLWHSHIVLMTFPHLISITLPHSCPWPSHIMSMTLFPHLCSKIYLVSGTSNVRDIFLLYPVPWHFTSLSHLHNTAFMSHFHVIFLPYLTSTTLLLCPVSMHFFFLISLPQQCFDVPFLWHFSPSCLHNTLLPYLMSTNASAAKR